MLLCVHVNTLYHRHFPAKSWQGSTVVRLAWFYRLANITGWHTQTIDYRKFMLAEVSLCMNSSLHIHATKNFSSRRRAAHPCSRTLTQPKTSGLALQDLEGILHMLLCSQLVVEAQQHLALGADDKGLQLLSIIQYAWMAVRAQRCRFHSIEYVLKFMSMAIERGFEENGPKLDILPTAIHTYGYMCILAAEKSGRILCWEQRNLRDRNSVLKKAQSCYKYTLSWLATRKNSTCRPGMRPMRELFTPNAFRSVPLGSLSSG